MKRTECPCVACRTHIIARDIGRALGRGNGLPDAAHTELMAVYLRASELAAELRCANDAS